MNKQNNNEIKDPCIWCCFPCLMIWTIMEKSLQSSCLCFCKLICCDFKKNNELKKVSNTENEK